MWRATPLTSRYGASVLAVVLLVLQLTACDDPGDAALASCLSAVRRPVLVEAARSLGLGGVPGDDASGVAAWRVARPADFDRACTAITPPAPTDPLTTGVLALLGGLAGALLTSGATVLLARANRRSDITDALRDAGQRLLATTGGMLLLRTGRQNDGPPMEQLLDRVAALDNALRRARPMTHDHDGIDEALRYARELPSVFSGAWPPAGRPASIEKATAAQQAVDLLLDRVETIAAERRSRRVAP